MKEIFIIKDDFEDFNEINDFFIKRYKIQSFELKELNGIDGSKSALLNQKLQKNLVENQIYSNCKKFRKY